MPDGKVLQPCEPSFTLVSISLTEGFSQGRDRPSSLRISFLAWGEKTVVKKKTQLCDPRLRKTSSSVGEGKGVDRDGSKKKKVENRHPGYRN